MEKSNKRDPYISRIAEPQTEEQEEENEEKEKNEEEEEWVLIVSRCCQ